MKFITTIMMFCTVALSGCQSKESIQISYKNSQIQSSPRPQLISQREINFKLQDQNSFRSVAGKISLYKSSDGCQIDKALIYSKSVAVIYQYFFNIKELISSHTLVPDEFNKDQVNRIWDDPKDSTILQNFNDAKQVFSAEEFKQCN